MLFFLSDGRMRERLPQLLTRRASPTLGRVMTDHISVHCYIILFVSSYVVRLYQLYLFSTALMPCATIHGVFGCIGIYKSIVQPHTNIFGSATTEIDGSTIEPFFLNHTWHHIPKGRDHCLAMPRTVLIFQAPSTHISYPCAAQKTRCLRWATTGC